MFQNVFLFGLYSLIDKFGILLVIFWKFSCYILLLIYLSVGFQGLNWCFIVLVVLKLIFRFVCGNSVIIGLVSFLV
jgi:hypothetical protein